MNRFQSVLHAALCYGPMCFDAGGKALRCEFELPLLKVGLMHKIGFVRCGHRRAMLSGVLSAGLCESGDIIVSARTQKTLGCRS